MSYTSCRERSPGCSTSEIPHFNRMFELLIQVFEGKTTVLGGILILAALVCGSCQSSRSEMNIWSGKLGRLLLSKYIPMLTLLLLADKRTKVSFQWPQLFTSITSTSVGSSNPAPTPRAILLFQNKRAQQRLTMVSTMVDSSWKKSDH